MDNPYRARVADQRFLNLPGFHGGAYIRAYVEDTSARDFDAAKDHVPDPRLVLEISDCYNCIALEFDVSSPAQRMNSFHKIDSLVGALEAFRAGMAGEAAIYRRRCRAIEAHRADSEGGAKRSSQLSSAA